MIYINTKEIGPWKITFGFDIAGDKTTE